jgi:hypothetical protein
MDNFVWFATGGVLDGLVCVRENAGHKKGGTTEGTRVTEARSARMRVGPLSDSVTSVARMWTIAHRPVGLL